MFARPWYVFGFSLIIALIVQATIWQVVPLADRAGWLARIEALSVGQLAIFELPTFANPDAAMLTVAAIGHRLGATLPGSLRGATALLNALLVAGVIATAYLMYPQSPWWVAAGSFLLFNDAYLESAPHDVILAPAIVLLVLLTLYIFKQFQPTWPPLLAFGLVAGIALATFLPLSPLFILPPIGFLLVTKKISRRHTMVLLGATLLSLLAFDSLLWRMPAAHLQAIRGQLVMHSLYFPNTPLPWLGFFNVAPFALLGFALATAFLAFRRRLPAPLPYSFLLLLGGLTVFVTACLLTAKYKTFRSFHPLFFIWEVFLPLFIFQLIPPHPKTKLVKLLPLIVTLAPLVGFTLAYREL